MKKVKCECKLKTPCQNGWFVGFVGLSSILKKQNPKYMVLYKDVSED